VCDLSTACPWQLYIYPPSAIVASGRGCGLGGGGGGVGEGCGGGVPEPDNC